MWAVASFTAVGGSPGATRAAVGIMAPTSSSSATPTDGNKMCVYWVCSETKSHGRSCQIKVISKLHLGES